MISYNTIKEKEELITNSRLSHLECSRCRTHYSENEIQTFCTKEGCHSPLLAKYDTSLPLNKDVLRSRANSMWRYREMLPLKLLKNMITLGEGMTPLLSVPRLAGMLGLEKLLIKDEASNPTGSFKARGLSMAVSKAQELGADTCCIPTAGNAGSALSAYCSRAGMESIVYMPEKTPDVFKTECDHYGAKLNIVGGTISNCGQLMKKHNADGNWFDISTLKEPYRLEGKKTMGYEIAEQMEWQTPDVLIYPTGGGTGLIGIWKAFREMLALGWIKRTYTRMVAVQVAGCAPIVKAFKKGLSFANPIEQAEETIANGLRVPHAFGHRLILETIRDSGGTALTVTDSEMKQGIREIAKNEGLFVCPEGAAVWMALKKLVDNNWIKGHERVVLLNTGTAYKYIENIK